MFFIKAGIELTRSSLIRAGNWPEDDPGGVVADILANSEKASSRAPGTKFLH